MTPPLVRFLVHFLVPLLALGAAPLTVAARTDPVAPAERATCPAPIASADADRGDSTAADPSAAQEDPRTLTVEQSAVRDTMKRILAGPDFSPEEVRKVPRFKQKDRKPEAMPEWMKSLEAFFKGLAEIARVLVWILVAVGVVALLVGLHYWWRMSGARLGSGKVDLPTQVAGLDIRPESLPDDIGAAARAAWQRGDPVQALSLLYRGALSALVLRAGVAIRSSFTEQECLRATRKSVGGAVADYFARLTQAWIFAVYARRLPSDDAALALCEEFNRHFARPAPAATGQGTVRARPAT